MNHTPKVVVSKTLEQAPWGKYEPAQIIKDNVKQRIIALKEKPGKNIVIYGSGKLVQNLTELGLIDEYQLLVHPILLGGGKPLFGPTMKPISLKLVNTETFSNGVVVLYYGTQ